jgi:tetratricopeptide (TPR) repeat protein
MCVAGAILTTITLSVLTSCGGTPDTLKKDLGRADRNFAVGNYVDSLKGYAQVAPQLETAEAEEARRARLGEAVSLYFTGRLEEASSLLSKLADLPEFKEMDPASRRSAYFYRGQAELELGRLSEPSLVLPSPLNLHDIKARERQASDHFCLAQHSFTQVLKEVDSSDFEARLGKGECLLRIGMLSESVTYLREARDILTRCGNEKPGHKSALFLRGQSVQEDLGGDQLHPRAASDMLVGLKLDKESNHDMHVAYRDVLVFVRKYKKPPTLVKWVPDVATRSSVKSLIDHLDSYLREGHRLDDPWGKDLDAHIQTYLTEFHSWDRDKKGLRENIAIAERIIRRTDQEFIYLDAFREAMRLLDGVAEDFHSEVDYIEARKEIQAGYVLALLESVDRLKEIDEWALAERHNQEALDHVDRRFVDEVSTLLKRGQTNINDLKARMEWHGLTKHVRDLIRGGELKLAHTEYRLRRSKLKKDSEMVIGKEAINGFESELEKDQALKNVMDLLGSGASEFQSKPREALKKFTEARKLAEQHEIFFWQQEIAREIAKLHYQLGEFQICLQELSHLEESTPYDQLLTAKCYYPLGEFGKAAQYFGGIEDPDILKSGADQTMAGLVFLKIDSSQPRRARSFLERAVKVDPESGEAREGLKECYRQLVNIARDDGDRWLLGILLQKLTTLDPDDYNARQLLGIQLFEDAIDNKDPETCALAFKHLEAASRGGVRPRNDADRKRMGQLLACYATFLPLSERNSWTYRTSTGNTRVVRVVKRLGDERFSVQISEGGNTFDEVWTDAHRIVKRYNPEAGISEEFPISLRWPTNMPVWQYNVKATDYEAKVVGTGVECVAAGKTHRNCLQIQVSSRSGMRNYFFAPGIGEVKMEGPGLSYELVETNVDSDVVASLY